MKPRAYPIQFEVAGPTALWTRPDTGDSPISSPFPSSSQVVGLVSNILWLPNILIRPKKCELCSMPVYHSYAFNYGGPLRKVGLINKGANYQMFATVLVDVCYRIYADIYPNEDKDKLPPSALAWDKRTTSPAHAYQEIFYRRLKRGQSHSPLSLGLREYTASYVGEFRHDTRVMEELDDIVIPSMVREVFSEGYNSKEVSYTYDNNVVAKNGVLIYR